jgi:DNA polymerase III delta subunit
MLFLFYGSDRDKARTALNKVIDKASKRVNIVRITDAHTAHDLRAALQGPGMFSSERVVVLDSILGGENMEMNEVLLGALERMRDSQEKFYMLEGALNAATKKSVEKYAEKSERYDAPKKEKDNSIFALANALERGDRKELWIGLQKEFAKGSAPEAVHGLLFWGAKKMLLNTRDDSKRTRAKNLVARLTELPHEARRRGIELEYALEHFALSGA